MSIKNDLIQLEAIAKELERRKYRDSLYLLDKHILGYDSMNERTHNDLCLFAQYNNNEANIDATPTPTHPIKDS